MSSPSTAPAQPKALAEIERLGFGYKEVAQFDLSKVSVERRVQAREGGHYAPRENVAQYAEQMRHTAFPPIVMTSDDWIIDGNTRVGACALRKEKFFPAVIVDVQREGASQRVQDQLMMLAATLNNDGGARLTGKETRKAVRAAISLGWLNEQIGRSIGVKGSAVTLVRKEIDAELKLEKVGLSPEAVEGASLRALGAKDVLALNDVPFKDLAELAADAGLNATEIISAAKDARATGSDQGAIQHLADLRTECGDRIAERRLTGAGKPPVSRQLRQHLGFITKYAAREQELIETNPAVGAQHIEALKAAIAVLTSLLNMQQPA